MPKHNPQFTIKVYQGRQVRATVLVRALGDDTSQVECDYDKTPTATAALTIMYLMAAHCMLADNHPDQSDDIQRLVREIEQEAFGSASFQPLFLGTTMPLDDEIVN